MEIVVSLSKLEHETIKNESRRGKRGEDVFSQLRILFCASHDESECDRWENCRVCVLNNIEWRIKEND